MFPRGLNTRSLSLACPPDTYGLQLGTSPGTHDGAESEKDPFHCSWQDPSWLAFQHFEAIKNPGPAILTRNTFLRNTFLRHDHDDYLHDWKNHVDSLLSAHCNAHSQETSFTTLTSQSKQGCWSLEVGESQMQSGLEISGASVVCFKSVAWQQTPMFHHPQNHVHRNRLHPSKIPPTLSEGTQDACSTSRYCGLQEHECDFEMYFTTGAGAA